MSKHLNDSTRLSILEEYLSSSLSKRAIARKYGITKPCISRWLRKFGCKELGHAAYKMLVELAEETYVIEILKNLEAK